MADGLKSIVRMACLSAGLAMPMENWNARHTPRPDLSYTTTPKPPTKRQRRRLRGKARNNPHA